MAAVPPAAAAATIPVAPAPESPAVIPASWDEAGSAVVTVIKVAQRIEALRDYITVHMRRGAEPQGVGVQRPRLNYGETLHDERINVRGRSPQLIIAASSGTISAAQPRIKELAVLLMVRV
jgi:hypothetical protein